MRRRIGLAGTLVSMAIGLAWPHFGHAAPLVADISDHLVAIDSRFVGAELTLFGAAKLPGDVVVVVRGPKASMVVRRKQRVAGIWINRQSMEFQSVPRFYAIAATKPLDELASPEILDQTGIGLEHLDLRPRSVRGAEPIEVFRRALLRREQARALYAREVAPIELMGNRLFRASIALPANIATGVYSAEVYLFRDGNIVASRIMPLNVRKTGLEAQIFEFAHESPWLYGLLAIAATLMAGWLGSVVFPKPVVR